MTHSDPSFGEPSGCDASGAENPDISCHPPDQVTYRCIACGKGLCETCGISIAEQSCCPECFEKLVEKAGSAELSHASPQSGTRLPATMGLLVLLLGVFLVSSFPGLRYPQPWALDWGLFSREAIVQNQYWRFLTAPLMHADWNHLLSNCFGVLIFGQLLEPVIGSRRLLQLFVMAGLGSMLMSYIFVSGTTLGASGIDYGLIGAYLTLMLMFRRRQNPAMYRKELRGALLYVLVFAAMDFYTPHINLWGHLGGLLTGVIYALGLVKRPKP